MMTTTHESSEGAFEFPKKLPKLFGVISSLSPGGAEHIFSEVMCHFSQRMAVTIILLQSLDSSSLPVASNITILPLNSRANQTSGVMKWFEALRVLVSLRQILIREKPEVVVSFMTQTNIFVALASVGLRMRRVFCERVHPGYALKSFPFGLSAVQRSIRNMLYRMSEKIVVQSQYMKSDFPPTFAGRLVVIPNFVRASLPIADAHGARVKKKEGKTQILWVGRLVPQKDSLTAVRAFAQLSLVRPEVLLTLIGRGPDSAALEAEIERLGLQSRIELIPYAKNMDAYYRQADILLSTSLFEGFPNVVLEAMSFGVPVVATDCPGATRELVQIGRNGYLAPCGATEQLANYLRILVEDGSRRTEFARNALQLAAAFERKTLLNAWLGLVL